MPDFDSEFIVNWNQGKVASDKLIRVHRKSHEVQQCQLKDMKEYSAFNTEESAQRVMRERNFSSYKHCTHCWDGQVISIPLSL